MKVFGSCVTEFGMKEMEKKLHFSHKLSFKFYDRIQTQLYQNAAQTVLLDTTYTV